MRTATTGLAILVLLALSVLSGCESPGQDVVYKFPSGFQGQWFIIVDPTMPSDSSPVREINFDSKGLAMINQKTFDNFSRWHSSKVMVGDKKIEFAPDKPSIEVACFDMGTWYSSIVTNHVQGIGEFVNSGYVGTKARYERWYAVRGDDGVELVNLLATYPKFRNSAVPINVKKNR